MAIRPSITSANLSGPETILEPSPVRLMSRRAFGHVGLLAGGSLLLIMLLVAIFAPIIAPFDPYDQDLAQRLIPPVWQDSGSWAHPLGTDNLGRDYISRIIYGSRISSKLS